MTTKVLIIGTGAIGAFYGALLAKAGAEVAVVCRSDYEQVKQHGFSINSHALGTWTFTPSQVLKTKVSELKLTDKPLINKERSALKGYNNG